MTHDNADHLTVLLNRAADQVQISPAPTRRILATRRRVHRRETLGRCAVAAVMLTAVVIAGIWTGGGGPADRVVPAGPGPEASSSQPASTKLDGAWTVTALAGDDPTPSALKGHLEGRVELRFENGRVKGYTGCNWVGASYEQSGDQGQDITINPQSSSEVACPKGEPPLADRLSEVRHVTGAGDTRSLRGDDGQSIFELTRR